MARSRKPTPSYLFHKATGRAHAVWTDATGAHLQKLLPGKYDSTESRTAFAQLQLEIEASPLQSPDIHSERVSVNELMLAYIEHAEQHYRGPEGKPTGETQHVKVVCRYVRELYGHTLAVEFGPLALKAVRQKFVKAGWCRRSVNQQIERVRRAFRWAAGEELIPFEVYHRLTAVSGLQRGRTEAREPDPVKPVDDAIVDATLQHLSRHVRGLVEFQRLTGCRPGEACRLRRCDIETGGTVWLYRPPQHKGSWRGKSRTIAIGPKAQELLKEFFTANITDHLFSPRRAVEEVRAVRAKNRKTPRYPSHLKRNATKRKTNPKRTPSDRYNRVSYVVAVARACDRAYPPRGDLAQRPCETTEAWKTRLKLNQPVELRAWQKAHRWSPNQLRHSYATKVRKEHGLETPGVRISFALHRLGVTQGEPDGPDEDEIRARSNQNNVRRQSHGPGPFIFVAPSRPGEAGHAHITLHLILHPRHQVRAAALAHIEQSPEGDTAWLVPRSRSVIAEYRNALLSKASNVWQPAVARLSDVLEEDFLLNMAAYRQCVVVGLGAEELVYWGRIIRPGLSLFASVPDTWYAAPTPSTWQEEINVMVHDSGSLRECLDRYLKRFGHLPLASPFSAGACVRSWVEARGGSDTVWGEVWDWANETLDPLRRYHAVQVFLECPYVTSESRRKEAWDAVADVLSWARLRTDSTNPYATGWELRVELARHYLGHLELYAIDQPGDRLAALAWWTACRVAELLLPPPRTGEDPTDYMIALRGTIDQALAQAAQITEAMWGLARPTTTTTLFSFGTMEIRSLFSVSLLLSPRADLIGHSSATQVILPDTVEIAIRDTLLNICVSGFSPVRTSSSTSSCFAIEESVIDVGRAWLGRFQNAENRRYPESMITVREIISREGELVKSLGQLSIGNRVSQLTVAHTFRSLHALGIADEVQAWALLQDREWTRTTFSSIDQEAMHVLCWGFVEVQRRTGGRWNWFLPQVFAFLATLRDIEPQRQRLLALMLVRSSIVGGCMSEIRELVTGELSTELCDYFEDLRNQLERLRAFAPPHVAGLLRDVTANLVR